MIVPKNYWLGSIKKVQASRASPGQKRWMKLCVLAGSMVCGRVLMKAAIPSALRHAKQFRANQKAWNFFQAQAPSYQKVANWWVMSAKKEETRLNRLTTLIADSEKGLKLAMFTRWSGKQS